MAELFLVERASHSGVRKRMVLKRIHERFSADPLIRSLFIQEARTHALLNHPHIVQIFDFGHDGEFLYMALEYVNGGDLFSLGQNLAKRPAMQRVMVTVQAAVEMASALVVTHGHVIHQDISPSNILYSKEGFFKLCDFGLAKDRSKIDRATISMGQGKCRYMPPERICGEASDHRSDLFSLGACLAEFYSGRKLYGDLSNESLQRLIRQGGYLKQIMALDLPNVLGDLVYRAVQPSPNDRFQSAEEFLRAAVELQSLLNCEFGLYSLRTAFNPMEDQNLARTQRKVGALVSSETGDKNFTHLAEPAQQWARLFSVALSLPILLFLPFLGWLRKRTTRVSKPGQGSSQRSRNSVLSRSSQRSSP